MINTWHPALHGLTDPKRCLGIPVGLHGDDAKDVKRGKMLVLSLNGPLCRDAFSRLVLAILDYRKATEETENELYRVLAWSFEVLAKGVWPETCL